MTSDDARNMKLIGHDTLAGYGGIGEGISIQLAKDGRRIMWLAHEGPPKNFTGVDVTDPRRPKVIIQTDLPHKRMRSNSLEVVGDVMAVAYQTRETPESNNIGFNVENAGIELFDISTPEKPKSISFFDCVGPGSMGVHQLWFVDGEYIHCAAGAPDFIPRDPQDCQFYRCAPTTPTSIPSARTGSIWAISMVVPSSSILPTRRTRRWSATGTRIRPSPVSPIPCFRCSTETFSSYPTRASWTARRTGQS
jgi:hypothetical protein